MALKTKGTHLYFIDPATPDTVHRIGCPTSITGPSSPIDQIEVTCLESTAREYTGGLKSPGTAQFTINLDFTDSSHVLLKELFTAGTDLKWALGYSDGTANPTALTGDFVFPTTRSYFSFEGYISDFTEQFDLNAVVVSNVSIQVSGETTWYIKA